jgi:hypothetical protein
MSDLDIKALSMAALDAIKPRWRVLPKKVKEKLLSDVSKALSAVSGDDTKEVEQSDEV